jgi:hypothetical protein
MTRPAHGHHCPYTTSPEAGPLALPNEYLTSPTYSSAGAPRRERPPRSGAQLRLATFAPKRIIRLRSFSKVKTSGQPFWWR